MVGVCGVVGTGESPPASMVDGVRWCEDEREWSFVTDSLGLAGSFHALLAGDQPARAAGGDVLVWVWGDVYGHGTGDSHTPRGGPPDGSAAYCAELYDRHGMGFVEELNGDFALLLLDREAGELSVVTDRIGTRPLFYARPTEETLVFASNVQALPRHPRIAPEFDREYLAEYLTLRRVFGVETPIRGVREFPPASVVTIDLAAPEPSAETYWRPSYDPVEQSFESYAEEFTETLQQVLAEWTREDLEYGLLLSGGGDSRLVMAGMDASVTAYHIADWMSREATVARRAASAADTEFRLLERDESYEARALERTPRVANFSGWFDQAYFADFTEKLAQEVDVLVSGLYADMLFGGGPFRKHELSLGSIGRMTLPVRDPVESVAEYVDFQTGTTTRPPYADVDAVDAVLRRNIRRDDGAVYSHGVRYDSLAELVMYGDFYPMSADTDAIFSRNLMHIRPYRTPFLDNRLLDLQQRIPVRYFLRRNFVNRAVTRLDSALADVPHARTGVPLKFPFSVEYLGGHLNGFRRKHLFEEPPPAPHLDHGPWPDRAELLRARSFAASVLDDSEPLFDALPFLDREAAMACYRDHLDGADNTALLYSLLTFLKTPVAAQSAGVAIEQDTVQAVDGSNVE